MGCQSKTWDHGWLKVTEKLEFQAPDMSASPKWVSMSCFRKGTPLHFRSGRGVETLQSAVSAEQIEHELEQSAEARRTLKPSPAVDPHGSIPSGLALPQDVSGVIARGGIGFTSYNIDGVIVSGSRAVQSSLKYGVGVNKDATISLDVDHALLD